MKIAIDARILPSSTGRYVERLLYYLQQIDSHNTYYILLDKQGMKEWQPANHKFQKVLADYSMFGLDGQLQMAKALARLEPDLVHFSFQQAALPYRGKYVITVHDLTQLRFKNTIKKHHLTYSTKQKILKTGIKRAVKRAEFVITPTRFVKHDVERFFRIDPSKVVVTYEAAEVVDHTPPRPIKDLQNSEFILYVGTAHTHKNLTRLIDVLPKLQAKHPGLRLVLAGKKSDFHQKLIWYAADNQVEGLVMLGYVEQDQLNWLYGHCRAYVFPSLSEGFGLPTLEAMRHGAPVACSNATCLPEVNGDAVRYFNPHDGGSLFEAVDDLLTNPKLRQELVERGTKQVNKYSWRTMAEETLEIYNKAVSP